MEQAYSLTSEVDIGLSLQRHMDQTMSALASRSKLKLLGLRVGGRDL